MNRLLFAAACLGVISVAMGALGAHGLEGQLVPGGAAWWNTATLYGLSHAVAAISLALARTGRILRLAGWLAASGAGLFSATLYALSLGAPGWFGAITPVGGLGMIAGWTLAGVAACRTGGRI
jgi:uncharacterized membrane protein YgdD (TMEM256/DUF423 family)